jgi:hypothetical protein
MGSVVALGQDILLAVSFSPATYNFTHDPHSCHQELVQWAHLGSRYQGTQFHPTSKIKIK